MGPILELDGVSKRYGAVVVAEQVSLAVAPGEAVGVIGPNGAGKSTLFNLIAGEVRPDAGRILFQGRDITGLPAFERCRRGMARSYQVPRPFAGMTVFENLLVGAAFGDRRSEAESHAHCIEVLRRTGLVRKANLKAGTLTLLERKRLELARALATNPNLLLLDEIAGGLSEDECRELAAAIRDIHATGVALIWVEHVLHALRAVVSRLIVISLGRKLDDGPPQRVMASPQVQELYLGIEAEAPAGA